MLLAMILGMDGSKGKRTELETMTEHNIKTVPIYFQNEKIGTADIGFHTNVADKNGHIHEFAWTYNNIQIRREFKEILEKLSFQLHAVLDLENKEGVALTIGYPQNELSMSNFLIQLTYLAESEISKISYFIDS